MGQITKLPPKRSEKELKRDDLFIKILLYFYFCAIGFILFTYVINEIITYIK